MTAGEIVNKIADKPKDPKTITLAEAMDYEDGSAGHHRKKLMKIQRMWRTFLKPVTFQK